jgi:hypothetical protein
MASLAAGPDTSRRVPGPARDLVTRSCSFVTNLLLACDRSVASVVLMASKAATTKAATPWGAARVVDEVKVQQRAGEKRFASWLQLLEDEGGELLVRFAYSTDGIARRGPVTLRARDVERLRAALDGHPALARLLGWEVGA